MLIVLSINGKMKKLYFLHIPKTAGQFITKSIGLSLDKNGIDNYFLHNGQFVSEKKLKECVFVAGHFGTFPTDVVNDMEAVTILRDPVQRAVSQFNFLYEQRYRHLYRNIDGYINRLKFYLFEDENMFALRNYQARFLCNPANKRRFESQQEFDNLLEEFLVHFEAGAPNTWFVENELTSLSLAKSKLDSMSMVGTFDNLDKVLKKINAWFLDSYGVEIEYTKDKINVSSISENGVNYTTEDCVEMLSKEEISRFRQINSIDQELYEYAKLLSI
jgi:hypothetical protein